MTITSDNVTDVVEVFVKGNARSLQPEDQEDFRQDVLVALIEKFGSTFDDCGELDVFLISMQMLAKFRAERRAISDPQVWFDDEHLKVSSASPNFDLDFDLKKALDRLPTGLRNVALDLFYNNLTQQEVADKYKRTQPWVAVAKKQIVQKIYSFLQEKKPCRF